jgi:hypothetical protein
MVAGYEPDSTREAAIPAGRPVVALTRRGFRHNEVVSGAPCAVTTEGADMTLYVTPTVINNCPVHGAEPDTLATIPFDDVTEARVAMDMLSGEVAFRNLMFSIQPDADPEKPQLTLLFDVKDDAGNDVVVP